MTTICYDTEFIERGPEYPVVLVSIGMVRDDGAEFYAVSRDFSLSALLNNSWLADNVWPYLPQTALGTFDAEHEDVKSRKAITRAVSKFVLDVDDPQLWAWYGAYDHVVLCGLFGRMIDLPRGFPMWTNDLKQEAERLGNPRVPEQAEKEHHALADARHDMAIARFLGEMPDADPRLAATR